MESNEEEVEMEVLSKENKRRVEIKQNLPTSTTAIPIQ